MANSKEVLYRMDFNDTNFLLVTKSEFNGKEYLDARKYFVNDKGQEIATKKGLTLSYEEWFKLAIMLQDIIENKDKEDDKVKEEFTEVPNTEGFDYKSLDAITLNDGNPFADYDFPF